MENKEMDKAIAQIIVEIIEYIPNSVVSKTIIKKTTGNITAMSFDTGTELTETTSPFDTFIQVIDGSANIAINDQLNIVKLGEGIIIPAHASSHVKSGERFKMIMTVIKSGYE